MKHFLNIWALLMLFLHLSSLAYTGFLPAASAGVSIKKVCLRKQAKAQVAASAKDFHSLQNLFFQKAASADLPESGTEVSVCSVKLFCTPATSATAFLHPLPPYLEPGFVPVAYYSQISPTEPDPPKFS